jgi:hypothetical protein
MNTAQSMIGFEVESPRSGPALEETVAQFLVAENARCDGIPLLPALDLLDWGHVSAGRSQPPARETTSELPLLGTARVPPTWLVTAGALLAGTGLGTCLGIVIAGLR